MRGFKDKANVQLAQSQSPKLHIFKLWCVLSLLFIHYIAIFLWFGLSACFFFFS